MFSFFRSKNDEPLSAQKEKIRFSTWYPLQNLKQVGKECLTGLFAELTIQLPLCYGIAKLQEKFLSRENKISDAIIQELKKQILSRSGRFKLRIAIPIGEEIVFRGILLPVTQKGLDKLGVSPAYQAVGSSLISSAIFGLMHGKGRRIYASVAGFGYAAMTYYFNGSLWAATTGHMVSNTLATGLMREQLISSYRRR